MTVTKEPPSSPAAISSSSDPDAAWLTAMLREELPAADDGFTDAVLARVPQNRARKSRLSRRDITLVSFGVVAGAVGAFGFARGTIALDTPLQLLCAAGVIGLGLWAALSSENA